MTPEQFEAKWGEALRACSADPDEIMGNCGDEYAEDTARGLLVAWAAERGHSVERLYWHEFGEPIGEGWGMSDGDALVSSNDFADFDAALIAGCIALAKEASKKGYDDFPAKRDDATT